MRIAIIGATGNVGTALLRRLQRARLEGGRDLELHGIARRLPDVHREPYRGVQWHAVDLGSETADDQLDEVLAGCDAVVHLAWVLQPNHDEEYLRRINVEGTARALAAAVRAGVGHFVCASSVGAYSPADKEHRVDESWPARGVASSHYSRFKGEQEKLLDEAGQQHPFLKIARLRPGLIFQSPAGAEIDRYFLGPFVPSFFLNKLRLPLLPIPRELVFQALHADDVADAYWRVLDKGASGAFNVAAEPVLTPPLVAGLLGASRVLHIPVLLLRALVGAAWSVRLLASDPGWVDMARFAPIMDTGRARRELGWTPARSSVDAVREILDGISAGKGTPASPPLKPAGSNPA